jgi:hypothetical protein
VRGRRRKGGKRRRKVNLYHRTNIYSKYQSEWNSLYKRCRHSSKRAAQGEGEGAARMQRLERTSSWRAVFEWRPEEEKGEKRTQISRKANNEKKKEKNKTKQITNNNGKYEEQGEIKSKIRMASRFVEITKNQENTAIF